MTNITLYSAWYCPFAQRTWMGLIHKGIGFEYAEIDPYVKSPEWLRISRGTGQVPVIVDADNGITVPDSNRSLEYLDAAFPDEIPIRPINASNDADAKYWMDYQGRSIIPYMYRFLAADPGSNNAHEARRMLELGLETIAAEMDAEGPYFYGSQPGAMDFSLAPFALRIEILLSHYMDYALPSDGKSWARYHQWWNAVRASEPLVKSSISLPDYEDRLVDFYLTYSKGGGQADVTAIK